MCFFMRTSTYNQRDLYARIKIYINGNFPKAIIVENNDYDLVGFNGENERIVITTENKAIKLLVSQNLAEHITQTNSTVFIVEDQSDVRNCTAGIEVVMKMRASAFLPTTVEQKQESSKVPEENRNTAKPRKTIDLFFKDKFPSI